MKSRSYTVVIERTGTGFSAYSPDEHGCAAVGDSEKETRQNFQDALTAHFDAMREVGEPIPEPRTVRSGADGKPLAHARGSDQSRDL